MAQKRDNINKETELKVPETTLTLCPPSIPTPRSDLKTGAVVDSILTHVSLLKRQDLVNKSTAAATEEEEEERTGCIDEELKKVKRREINRCSGCKRKVGLTGFRCRCGEMFCSDHRYSDRHDCSYDYKTVGREVIARENPVIRAAKLLKV